MCTFRQTTRGDRLVNECDHPHAGPDCPRRKYEEYGRRSTLSGHAPSFLSGASTPTTVTELGPPTPPNEATYATVIRSPGFGQEFLPTDRKPHTGHRRKHRRHGSTATLESQLAAMVMDPPRGPPKDPPKRTAAPAADPGSDSEGSRRRNRQPPPIDTSFLAPNLPPVVRNYASGPSSPDDDENARDRDAKNAKHARHAAIDEFYEEERRREKEEREEKAKDEYYKNFEAGRGDYRAEERARKARERLEKERLEREEGDDYAKAMAARERAREEARRKSIDNQSSSTWSSSEYKDKIKKGQQMTEELKRSPSPAYVGASYSYRSPRASPDDVDIPRSSTGADEYLGRLRESERRQTAKERSDKERSSPTSRRIPLSTRERELWEKEELLEAEMAVAEQEARVNKSKLESRIGRDSKGNLAHVRRRSKPTGGARESFQKRRVQIFNTKTEF